jgi:hypothetical protein
MLVQPREFSNPIVFPYRLPVRLCLEIRTAKEVRGNRIVAMTV